MINKFFLTICILASYLLMESGSAYALMQEAEADNTAQQAITETSEQETQTISDLAAPSSVMPTSDTTSAEAPKSNLSQVSERFEVGEELIVTFRVGNLNYGELFVIVDESGLFVNIEDFISLLNFPIVNTSSGEEYKLQGWFIAENMNFELTLFSSISSEALGRVVTNGIPYDISSLVFKEVGGERLFNFDFMAKLFGITLSFDLQSLSINAVPSVPLPAQARLARDKKETWKSGNLVPKYPNYDFGYFSRSHQLFDARINTSYRNNKVQGAYSVIGVQDISGFSARFFVNGTSDDFYNSANLTLKRQSVDGELLGFMKSTTFEVGDIRPVRVGSSTGNSSIGVNISNQKLGQLYNIDATNITGIIQSGWDVELYHNGVLVDKKNGTDGGKYEFLDVPLYGELNTFDVVKYGPQGQIQKERIERNIDASLFDEGPSYNISLTRSNSALFDQNQISSEDQNWLFSGTYNYAINNSLSSSFGHSIALDGSRNNNYTLGLNARLSPRLLAGTTLSFVNKDNIGLNLNFRSRLFDQYLTLGVGASKSGNSNAQSAILRMTGALYDGDLGRISYGNEYTGSWYDAENYQQNFNNSLTYSTSIGSLSHSFSRYLNKVNSELQAFSSGSVTFGTSKGLLTARLSANYDLSNATRDFEWKGVSASFNYNFMNSLTSQLTLNRSLLTDTESMTFGVNWQQPLYSLTAGVNHNSVGNTSVSLNARFSMAETPFGRGYVTSGKSFTSNALVAVRVFEDVNNNFIFDGEDRPIVGAKIKADQLNKRAQTGEDGIALLEGVTSFLKTDLSVDTGSLDDPYLLQSTISTSLTPREGLLSLINYPFVQGAEVEGLIEFLDQNGEKSPFANAPIEIVNNSNEVVKELKTEFDGYFYSDILYPSIYTIRVKSSYLERKEMRKHSGVIVNASQAGDLVTDVQLLLQKHNYKLGYQVYLAEFDTETAAKALLKIYRIRWANTVISEKLNVFKSFKDGKYYVGLGVYRQKEKAEEFCASNGFLGDRCAVRQDRFDVNG